MGIFSKPTRWIKKQTHGGLKKGLSASGLKSTIKGAAKNPLTYAVAAPFVLPALGGLAAKAGALGASKLGGLFKGGAAASDVGGLVEGAGDIAGSQGRFRKIASGVGSFLGGKDGFGADDLLKYGKAAGDAFGAYEDRERFGRMEDIANQEYAANAPLRASARQMLLDDSRPDLSSVFAQPEQRYRKVNIGSRV